MGLFDKIKNVLKKSESTEIEKPKKERKAKEKTPKPVLTDKEKATAAGEPYVNITKVEIDPNDVSNGAFELDFNDKFVANLVRAGYKQRPDDTDNIIVDRWFQTVCRNIALELYEQIQADPLNRDIRPIQSRDLGNGRTEVS